jgi:hypothetical protein
MQNPFQPNFQTLSGAAAASDYDNMSEEELTKLINAAHRVKTGRFGRMAPAVAPKAERIVDLDALLEKGQQ